VTEPRPYQAKAVEDIGLALTHHRCVVYVLPTGGGKTVIFSEIARLCHEAGTDSCIVVHRETLLEQASAKLDDIGVLHSVIAPGRTDFGDVVKVASVQTLVRRRDRHKFKLYIVDEGHHAVAGSYKKILDDDPDASVLLVTATPIRMDGRGLGEVAQQLIVGPSIRDLMDDGYLTEAVSYGPQHVVDVARARTTGGDYNAKDIQDIMDRKEITGDAVEQYRKHCDGVPAIAFCATVQHAEDVAAQFRDSGYRAASIDGGMGAGTIRERLAGLKDGSVQVLTSCDLISEGFDAPGVQAGILLRQTKSLAVYMQQVGRLLRPVYAPGFDLATREGRLAAMAASSKKKAIILDHAGNAFRHGLADEEREWSLASRKKGDAGPVIKTCPACFGYSRAWEKSCRNCGHFFVVAEREGGGRGPGEQVAGELTQLDAGLLRKFRTGKDLTYRELLEVGRLKGKWPGWAYKTWIDRGGDPAEAR
jgi:DNA repair protein RadD